MRSHQYIAAILISVICGCSTVPNNDEKYADYHVFTYLNGQAVDYTPSICAEINGQIMALTCAPIDDNSCEYVDPRSGEAFEGSWSDTCPAVYCGSPQCLLFSST